MLIISNHLIGKMPIPDDAIIRINLAWVKNIEEAERILTECKNDVYLDYPQGRTKPPKPSICLEQAVKLANKYGNVKYFAVSNAEKPGELLKIKNKLWNYIELVPKLETETGIKNMDLIVAIGVKTLMLDGEDLWSDVKRDNIKFNDLVKLARVSSERLNVNLLELQGVVFK